jgi:hypothetical protein
MLACKTNLAVLLYFLSRVTAQRVFQSKLSPGVSCLRPTLEVEAEFDGFCSWRHVVRAAKGGKVIVQSGLVGQIDDRKAQAPTVAIPTEQIVLANRDVEQTAWSDPLRIVIVVFLARYRHLKIDRAELICRAGSHGGSKGTGRGTHASAREPGLELLIGGQRQTGDAVVQQNQASVGSGPRYGIAT